jgi:hypothetical protein
MTSAEASEKTTARECVAVLGIAAGAGLALVELVAASRWIAAVFLVGVLVQGLAGWRSSRPSAPANRMLALLVSVAALAAVLTGTYAI